MKIIVYILFTVRYSDCVETMNHKQRQDEMKTKNLIKAIEKTGLKVEVNGNWYMVKGPRNYGKFCDQDGRAVCVSTCDNNESSQPEIDYFPQWYHETIKSFIADLTKPARKKYDISTFSEDFATNTEVRDIETGKIIDRLYIGATNWDCDQKRCAKQLNDFIQKYEKLNNNQ